MMRRAILALLLATVSSGCLMLTPTVTPTPSPTWTPTITATPAPTWTPPPTTIPTPGPSLGTAGDAIQTVKTRLLELTVWPEQTARDWLDSLSWEASFDDVSKDGEREFWEVTASDSPALSYDFWEHGGLGLWNAVFFADGRPPVAEGLIHTGMDEFLQNPLGLNWVTSPPKALEWLPRPTPAAQSTPTPTPAPFVRERSRYCTPAHLNYWGYWGRYTLTDRVGADDPTWAELVRFLKADRTNERLYVWPFYMCGDFARALHDNAERAGIRAVYVMVKLSADSSPATWDHGLNLFLTTDKGGVYIDSTGSSDPDRIAQDRVVRVKAGELYKVRSLDSFTSYKEKSGWRTYTSYGTVTAISASCP